MFIHSLRFLLFISVLFVNYAQAAEPLEPSYDPTIGLTSSLETKFIRACRSGDIATVRSALKDKVNVNLANSRGWTPLQEAAENGHLEIVKLLLDHKA